MAIITKFTCNSDKNDYLIVTSSKRTNAVVISSFYKDELINSFYFDKSTAIKFAKTLRTEINKIG